MCIFNAKDIPWYPHQPNFLSFLRLKWHIDPKKIDFGQVKFLVYNIRLPYNTYQAIQAKTQVRKISYMFDFFSEWRAGRDVECDKRPSK